MSLRQFSRSFPLGFNPPMRYQPMSKGALSELMRVDSQKFERMTTQMHLSEKNVLKGELNKRAEILEGKY